MNNDIDYLKQAIAIGNQVSAPYNFGAVVVVDGEVVASEYGHVFENNNPSLHAEVSAITAACERLGKYQLERATLYSSHEPCAMCFYCAFWAHIDRIVFANPASEQDSSMYELRNMDIFELSKRLTRPMAIDQLTVN